MTLAQGDYGEHKQEGKYRIPPMIIIYLYFFFLLACLDSSLSNLQVRKHDLKCLIVRRTLVENAQHLCHPRSRRRHRLTEYS